MIGANNIATNADALKSDYVYQNGQRVADSFTTDTHQGKHNPLQDAVVDLGVNAAGGAVAKQVIKYGDDVIGGVTGAKSGLNVNQGLLHTDLAKQAKAYLDDVQKQTGIQVSQNQRSILADNVRKNQYSKLSKEDAALHRKDFNKNKNSLISEWESKTGEKWPRYKEDVISKSGVVTRKIGQPYDAHHLIESSHGGPNQWWNIHPARFPDQHQGGIHRSESPARKLFSGGE
ncbi:hypothetical protein CBF23_014865 [Marinomonas agarivorans]|nr:hypothetical protein CBF23_014865 [Marinomonas agarivorans]